MQIRFNSVFPLKQIQPSPAATHVRTRGEGKFSSNQPQGTVSAPAGITFQATEGESVFNRILKLASYGYGVTIGANPDNLCIIDDSYVSGRHATVYFNQFNQLMIEDLGATNTTRVNGKKIAEPTALNANDVIKIGTCTVPVNSVKRLPIPINNEEAIADCIKLELAKGHILSIGRFTDEDTRTDHVLLRLIGADKAMSPLHGALHKTSNGYKFVSLHEGVTNYSTSSKRGMLGTHQSVELQSGDVLTLGNHRLVLP